MAANVLFAIHRSLLEEKEKSMLHGHARPIAPVDSSDRLLSFSEVRERGWTIIGEHVYDLGTFIQRHPGGSEIAQFQGMDATLPMINAHGIRGETFRLPRHLRVGRIDQNTLPTLDRDLRALLARAHEQGLFNYSAGRLCWDAARMLALAAAALLLLTASPLLAFIVGSLLMVDAIWWAHNVGHDAVFKSRAQARRLADFVSIAVLGAPTTDYSYTTHRLHHGFANVIGADPAIDTGPFVWDECMLGRSSEAFVAVQAWAWFLIVLPLTMPHFFVMGVRKWWQDRQYLRLALLALRWLAVIAAGWPVFWLALGAVLVGGAVMGLMASLSHFPKPMRDKLERSFGHSIACQTQNLRPRGRLATWLTGGLNFHIEHHLFATMPPHNYPLVAPQVRELFGRHGLPYYEVSLPQAVQGLWSKLRRPFETLPADPAVAGN
jgi:fatty acid desaturase